MQKRKEFIMEEKLKVVHLFSGIGAPERALDRLKIPYEIVGYSEIDKYAIQAYKALNGDVPSLGSVKDIERLPKANLVVYGSPCLTGDTLVLTKDGYKDLINVNIGDFVVGHDGSFHKVINFLEQGVKPTYRIKAMGMDSIRCTDNHKFYVRKMYRKFPTYENGKRGRERHFKEPEWVECKNLDKSYYLGMPVNNLSELPVWVGAVYNRSAISRTLDMSNPTLWYLCGRYLGDGWLKHRKDRGGNLSSVVICCGKHKIEKFEQMLSGYLHYTKVEDRTAFKYIFSNKELATFLSSFGQGAANKKIPGFVLDLHIDLLQHFVNGYLDSDGCYTESVFKATSTSRELIYGMSQCIAKVYRRPFSLYHFKRKPTHIIEGRVVNQRDSFCFTFHTESRIQDKAFYEDGYVWYPIQNIEPTGLNEPVYDITVEDCHSFVANNCITHNCQDFSVAGNQKGLIDSEGNQTRSGLLFEVERLIETAKAHDELPEYLLMENVKNLVSKKFKPDFDRWLNKLEELGYKNYWKVLNAKDYLIAQNRERVFVVSIRKDIDKVYEFPEPKPLTKRLKDILEEKVDEKYYLSDKAIAGFKKHNINHEAKGTGFIWKPKTGDDLANCLRANGALCPTDNTIIEEGNIYPNSGNPQAGRIYNSDGISPCLDTCSGGNRMPKIVEEPLIAASRGRYQEDGSTEQQLEINETGCANTLTTVQKDNLVVENKMRIRRLTPKECWRLMAFTDEEFDKVQATGISNTQLYKMAGNSIVVNCLIALFFNLLLKK